MDSLWKEFLGLAVSLQGQVWLGLEEKDMNSVDPLFTLRGLGALGLSTSSFLSHKNNPATKENGAGGKAELGKKPKPRNTK